MQQQRRVHDESDSLLYRDRNESYRRKAYVSATGQTRLAVNLSVVASANTFRSDCETVHGLCPLVVVFTIPESWTPMENLSKAIF